MRAGCTIILLSAIVTVLSSVAIPQVNVRDGLFYKNFVFNSDSLHPSHIGINIDKPSSVDTINPPYIKNDFLVNSLDGDYGCAQMSISGAADGNGYYAFTWIDLRNDRNEIFAQFYDNNGNTIGTNFKVNESILSGNNSPFIAANKNGDFVIVWLQNFQDVAAQRFNNIGQKIGANIIVNTTHGYNTTEPSVAVNNDGSFLIMWASENGDWDFKVHARLIDNSGQPIGSDIIISEPGKELSSIGQGKHIAVDQSRDYCITWSSYNNGSKSDIYLQQINEYGQLIGSNILVSNQASSSNSIYPVISSTDDGKFMIVWDTYNSYSIQCRIYDKSNIFITDVIILEESDGSYPSYAVSSDKDSVFYLYLNDYNSEYIQKIRSNGDFLGDTITVSYNYTELDYRYVNEMTDIVDGRFCMAIEGYIKTDENVYYQKFDSDINAAGSLQKINDDRQSSMQREPLVKFNNKGQSIVVWNDERNGRQDLYAQVYDQDFNPVNVNLQLNEVSSEYWYLQCKYIQTLSDGTFVVAFIGNDDSDNRSISLQAVSYKGEKIGGNILVKNNFYNSAYNLVMNVNNNDEVLVCWYNQYSASLRLYDKNLEAETGERRFINYSGNYWLNPFSVSIDSSLNIFAVWQNYDYTNQTNDKKIFGAFYDEYGNVSTSPFVIDSTTNNNSMIWCKNYGNNFVVIYSDYYSLSIKRKYFFEKDYTFDNRIYYSYPSDVHIVNFENQKLFITYNNYLDFIGFYINDNRRSSEIYNLHHYPELWNYEYNFNSADIIDDKILFTYEFNQNSGTGIDIWANVQQLKDINFNKEIFYSPVSSDYLYNNYPNPFNRSTKISYQLLAFHNVKLTIYDVLGRVVKVLVNANQERGVYEVNFDASNLASGIYFYRLEAFDTRVGKMILLK